MLRNVYDLFGLSIGFAIFLFDSFHKDLKPRSLESLALTLYRLNLIGK